MTAVAPEPGRCPRILHVTIGGAVLRCFFEGQFRFMAAHGLEIVVAARPGSDLEAFARAEQVKAVPVTVIRPMRPRQDFAALTRLVRIMRRERPDVVHVHTPKAALLGLLAALFARVPVRIYHLHALPLETARGPLRWLLYGCEALVSWMSTDIIAVSDSLRQRYRRFPGLRSERIEVLGAGSCNGVDARARFNPDTIDPADVAALRRQIGLPANARALCFLGRLAENKGITELVGAWQQLRQRYPDLWLILAGDIDEREPIGADVLATLERDPRVCRAGFVERCELVYALAQINLLPTYREGFGNVLIEAGAMGIPSVASRVTGCVDAVRDGVTGTLVPDRSVPPLVAAVARYLDHESVRARHGAAARERVLADFQPRQVWLGLLDYYAAALARRPGSSRSSSANRSRGTQSQFG